MVLMMLLMGDEEFIRMLHDKEDGFLKAILTTRKDRKLSNADMQALMQSAFGEMMQQDS